MKVMICDPHLQWADTLALLLEVAGHEVILAEHDDLDTSYVTTVKPDVLFYNCHLNGMTYCLESLVTLKRDAACRSIPVILLCTNQTEALLALTKAGLEVEFVLHMPFTLGQLQDALEMVESGLRARVN